MATATLVTGTFPRPTARLEAPRRTRSARAALPGPQLTLASFTVFARLPATQSGDARGYIDWS
jgi:hypothetical protein